MLRYSPGPRRALLFALCFSPFGCSSVDEGSLSGVRGTLRSGTADYPDQNRSEKIYWLELSEGASVGLKFTGGQRAPIGTELVVYGPREGDVIRVEDFEVVTLPNLRGPSGAYAIDNTPLEPPLKNGWVSLDQAYTMADLQARMEEEDFIKPVLEVSSYGIWTTTFDPLGPYSVPNDCGGSPAADNLGKNATQAMKDAGVDVDMYDQFSFYVPRAVGCSWGGFGLDGYTPLRTDGLRGEYNPWSYNVGSDSEGLIVQEIGHNYGLAHTHFCPNTGAKSQPPPASDCSGYVEYGSPYTPMSSGNGVYLNGWQRIQMNWLRACNVLTVATSGAYEIAPITLPCNGPQVLRVAADLEGDVQRYYYIEYRTPVGIEKTDGVLVHYSADLKKGGWSRCDWGGPDCPEDWIVNPTGSTAKDGLLKAGAEWETPEGVGIKVTSLGDTAKLEITASGTDAPKCMDDTVWDNAPPVCTGGTGGMGGMGGVGGTAGTGGAAGVGGAAGTGGGGAGGGGSGGGGGLGGTGTGGAGGTSGVGGSGTGGLAGTSGAGGGGGAAGVGGSAGIAGTTGVDATQAEGCACRVPGQARSSPRTATGLLGSLLGLGLIGARWRRRS